MNKKTVSALVLFLGTIWVYFNIFYTPFYIWAEGIYRPWLFLNGYVLFRDILWLRASFELYLLAGFYEIFGANPLNFQIFTFLIQSIIGIVMFALLYRKSFLLALLSYILYSLFAFLIYGTINQPAEILIGLFVFLAFYFYWEFIEKKNNKFLFFAGLATGFSLITKQTSLFIPLSVFLLLLIFSRKEILKKTGFYLLGSFVPVLIYAGYFALNNGLYDLFSNAIYNVFFRYPKTQDISLYPVDFSEAVKITALHLTILIPFICLKTNKIIPTSVKTALIIFILGLFPTLLPAFLSYRLISALPIFSVIVAIFLIQGYAVFKKEEMRLTKGIIILSAIVFSVQLGFYFRQSLQYIKDNGGFIVQEYRISDYSEDEKNVVSWLKNNTNESEKVFTIGNVLIMFYAKRLPQNRFSDSIALEYYPQVLSYSEITKNPARVVVYDSNTPTSMKNLKDWRYIKFLKENYVLAKAFGPYEIYVLR